MLATYQYADNNRIANIQPLAEYLNQKTGIHIEVKSYPSVHVFIEGIQQKEVDIALINTFGYFLLEASSKKYFMKPFAVLKVKDGAEDNYKTAIITTHDSRIKSFSEVKKTARESGLILVSPGSTSGNLVPRLALSSANIRNPEKEFGSLQYGRTHKATLDSVLLGKAEVGAIGAQNTLTL